ncbi:hypothetical protein BJ546DRAFT_10580 [Cryomyces antarcticus]
MAANKGLTFVTLDVFTHTKFSGNPLAIVRVPVSTSLTQEQKQVIAREFNLSETVFLHPALEGLRLPEWKIDIFTVPQEIPFAGHPIIGTACYVLSTYTPQSTGPVRGTFITKAGPISLEYCDGLVRASIPHNVHIHRHGLSSAELLGSQPALNKVVDAKSMRDQSPVVSIVKGMTFALVELSSVEALGHVTTTSTSTQPRLDPEWDESFVALYFYVCLPSSEEGLFNLRTRMIAGSLKDPATGSAASALTAYLSLQAGPRNSYRCAVAQGVEMGRRSDIGVDVTLSEDGTRVAAVTLSGRAVQVMEGTLNYQ